MATEVKVIKVRRGAYTDFDKTKMNAGEPAVTTSGDPNALDGKGVYMGVGPGQVKQVAMIEDIEDILNNAADEAVDEATQQAKAEADRAEAAATQLASTVTQVATNTANISELNERIGTIVGVPNTVRRAIYSLLNTGAYEAQGLTDEIAIVEDWAQVTATAIALSETSIRINGQGTKTLVATLTPPDSTDEVYWSSSDLTVAAVSQNGVVTSVGDGNCTIIASVGDLFAMCDVTVVNMPDAVLIKKSLANCSLSNGSTVVYVGSSYTSNITANSGYSLGNVIVKMGGVDITASAYSNGVITISNVTDTIEIDAFALPTGYTAYDYIYNNVADNGNGITYANQIVLPITGDKNDYKYETEYTLSNNATSACLMGGRDTSSGGTDSTAMYATQTSFAVHGHGVDTGYMGFDSQSGIKHHVIYDPITNPSTVTLDGITKTVSWTSSSQETSAHIRLFGNGQDNGLIWNIARNAIQIGRIKVTNSDNELVGDYVPCVNSSTVAGIYDLITNTFIKASSTTQYACANWT